LHRFLFAKQLRLSRDFDHTHLGTVCHHKTDISRAKPCAKKLDDSVFSHSREI